MKQGINLGISVSLACNMRHKFCYQTDFSSNRLSDNVLYNKLLDSYKKAEFICILGGEVTIIPGMKDYLQFVRANNQQAVISIVTNGKVFDDSWIDLCIENQIVVNFSLDASSENVAKKIEPLGVCSYAKVRNNYEKVLNAYKKKGLKLNCISMVVTDDTVGDIRDFVSLAAKDGVNVQILYTNSSKVCTTEMIKMSVFQSLKLKSFLRDYIDIRVLNLSDDNNINFMINSFDFSASELLENEREQFLNSVKPQKHVIRYDEWSFHGIDQETGRCSLADNGIYVMNNGDVLVCCCMTNYICGNIYQQSMDEILNSDFFKRVRKAIELNDYSYCWNRCRITMFPAQNTIAGGFWDELERLFYDNDYLEYACKCEKFNEPDRLPPTILYHLAYSLHMIKKYDKAIVFYDKALNSSFDEFWVRYNRADAYIRIGELELAREDIKIAYELDPKHDGIQLLYSQYCA